MPENVGKAANATPLFAGYTVAEVIAEEVHAHVERERARRPGLKVSEAKARLAEALSPSLSVKQLERYMSGENQMPIAHLLRFCRHTGSTRLVQFLAHEVGLAAFELPDPGEVSRADLSDEVVAAVREVGEALTAVSEAVRERPSEENLRRLAREMMDARIQLTRCERMAAGEVREALAARPVALARGRRTA